MFVAKPSTCFFVGNSDIDNNAGDSGAICFHSDGGVAADTQFWSETEAMNWTQWREKRRESGLRYEDGTANTARETERTRFWGQRNRRGCKY